MIQSDIRSRTKKIQLPVLLGIRLHPKTSDSLRHRNPDSNVKVCDGIFRSIRLCWAFADKIAEKSGQWT